MEKNISSKKQMREENISTSQSSFQDLVNRINSELSSLKEDLVAASLIHCDDEKIYDLSKKILDKYLRSIITISDENSLVTEKSICIHCTNYIDVHRYELEWKEISSHNQVDFLDFVNETMAPKLLSDVESFLNKVICYINNSLNSEHCFYLKRVSVRQPELDDSSCKIRVGALFTIDIK